VINSIADGIVNVVRAGYRRKAWLSAIALVLTLVIAGTYLFLGALRDNPLASTYKVLIELPESGGLLTNQDVTLRGVRIGRVEALALAPTGVNATVRLDSSIKIPTTTGVRVSGLSAAGEQYIDFDGGKGSGPYLHDGSVINLGTATVPVTLAELLANSDGVLNQVNVQKLDLIKKELSLSKEGPRKLADIIDGGTFLLNTLDGVLPETTSVLRNSRVVLQLAADKNAGIKVASHNLAGTFTGINKMTNGFRRLTNQTPGSLAQIDNLFSDNSDTMVQLLGSLATTSQLLYLRVPALNALFPDYRGSLLDSIGATMHDNGLWATGDLYPRYACDYGTPRLPPSSADYPEPFMFTYCRDDDPAVLIRGAKNAPRPAGDDTADPPPGADLGRRTDPTPPGRFTVPTPYGGPTLPIEPPH
jgi:virulence factor Mce-like protein